MGNRLCFVHSADRTYSDNQMFGVHFLPVWIYTLAASLPQNRFQLDLIDDRIESIEHAPPADLYLYSGINQDLGAILGNRAILAKRYPGAKHIIGGPICGSFQSAGKISELSPFDHIFIGDGEEALPNFLEQFFQNEPQEKIIQTKTRFDLSGARPMLPALLEKSVDRYYGAVIEVSRGCPFLCEFCDIRTLPDNNRSHVKSVGMILEEIDFFARRGKNQIVLACDNLLGNSKWAEELCDAIIQWKEFSGLNPSFYTWISIDIARHDRLLDKLRKAGIHMLFIGVESFHRNSLLETSKLQNTSREIKEEIRHIQSFGIIVVAGLIFGFDTEPENIVDITLSGILESGLISGDPSLLTALPGTPLYLRMKLSNRLRPGKIGLGGFKYQTNIKYLKPESEIIGNFQRFVERFNAGNFQYKRFLSFLSCIQKGGNFLSIKKGAGFTSLGDIFSVLVRNRRHFFSMAKRLWLVFGKPSRLFYVLRAAWYVHRYSDGKSDNWFYFKFWLFNWSNSVLKYSNLSARDFDIGSVDKEFSLEALIPQAYETTFFEPIPSHKIEKQRRSTVENLQTFVNSKLSAREDISP